MKTLLAGLLAMTTLGGCVAVPYYADPAPAGYYYAPAYPAASVHFQYRHYDGPRRHYRQRHYRHR